MVFDFLNHINLKAAMWIIPIIFFVHEMEEWNILDWYKCTYCPPPPSTKLSCRIWLFLISIFGFIITSIAYIISDDTISSGVILVFIVFSTFNGLQHIYWTIAFRKYAPGVIFSSLGIFAGIFITAVILSKNFISAGYIIILYIITIPFMLETFRAKNKLIRSFAHLHSLTLKIVDFLER